MRPTSPRWSIMRPPGSIWPTSPATRATRMGRNGSKRLLLVEDDRPLADLVKYHFDREGFTVTSTSAGDEAIILVDELKPDLVILDWMIEGISGIEVCRRLRRNPATRGLPSLMRTARGDEHDS